MKMYNGAECVFINKRFKNNNGSEILVYADSDFYSLIINNNANTREVWRVKNTIEKNFESICKIVNERYNDITPISDKESILEYIIKTQESCERSNAMGCSESWYDPFYAIKQTFTKEEVEAMTDDEINNLLRLVCNVQEGLY